LGNANLRRKAAELRSGSVASECDRSIKRTGIPVIATLNTVARFGLTVLEDDGARNYHVARVCSVRPKVFVAGGVDATVIFDRLDAQANDKITRVCEGKVLPRLVSPIYPPRFVRTGFRFN
jgi:hypothetical protein